MCAECQSALLLINVILTHQTFQAESSPSSAFALYAHTESLMVRPSPALSLHLTQNLLPSPPRPRRPKTRAALALPRRALIADQDASRKSTEQRFAHIYPARRRHGGQSHICVTMATLIR